MVSLDSSLDRIVTVLIVSHFEGKFMIARVETIIKIKGQLDSD